MEIQRIRDRSLRIVEGEGVYPAVTAFVRPRVDGHIVQKVISEVARTAGGILTPDAAAVALSVRIRDLCHSQISSAEKDIASLEGVAFLIGRQFRRIDGVAKCAACKLEGMGRLPYGVQRLIMFIGYVTVIPVRVEGQRDRIKQDIVLHPEEASCAVGILGQSLEDAGFLFPGI